MNKKLNSIVTEYTLRKDNQHVGSGAGGNIEYYMYLMSKGNKFSAEIKDVEINNDTVIYNPDFISNASKRDIRNILDQKIKESIEKEEFKSPISVDAVIDPTLVDDTIKDIDFDSILSGKNIDVSKFNATNQIVIAMHVCARLSHYLDSDLDKAKSFCDNFVKFMEQFNPGAALLAIRYQIGLQRLVSFNMDEDKYFGPFIYKINSLVN